VLNAAMLGLVAAVLDDFSVAGFWSAMFGALIVSLTSTIASWCIGPHGRYEVFVIRRR
jgi:putative membrane protein